MTTGADLKLNSCWELGIVISILYINAENTPVHWLGCLSIVKPEMPVLGPKLAINVRNCWKLWQFSA